MSGRVVNAICVFYTLDAVLFLYIF